MARAAALQPEIRYSSTFSMPSAPQGRRGQGQDTMLNRVRSHFYAYISKIRWLQRWGLKRNVINENVMEHSWEVATISHALALIRNRHFGGDLRSEEHTSELQSRENL